MTNFQTLLTRSMGVMAMSSPFALTLYENKLVFSDNSSGEIWQVDSMLGKPEGYPYLHQPLFKGFETARILGIKASHPSLQQYSEGEVKCLKRIL